MLSVRYEIDEASEEVTLFVGAESFRLCFSMHAYLVYYRLFGINPVFEPIGADPLRLAGLVWVSLLRFHSDVEPQLVNSWFDSPRNARVLVEAAVKALKLSIPDDGDVKAASTGNPPSA